MRRLIPLLLVLTGCNYFDLTDVLADVAQGPAGSLVVANETAGALQLLGDEKGVIEKQFPLGAVPVRLATHPDHSIVAVSYGDLESRIDLIDVQAGTGRSISLGKEKAIDMAWADADTLYVLNDRGFQDIMVVHREHGLIGGWPLDDLDFHSRIAVHEEKIFVNYRRYDAVLEGDGQLYSEWELSNGDFTKIVHKQRVASDGLGMLYAAEGTQAVGEYSTDTGDRLVKYDVEDLYPDERIVDFSYDPSGKWVFVMVRAETSHVVLVFDRASGEFQNRRYSPGSDLVGSNFDVEFLVPGDEAGEVFIYGHGGEVGAITRLFQD